MGEDDLRSPILACDLRADGVNRMRKWLDKHHDPLAAIGANPVLPCTSICEPDGILVAIGIRQAGSVRQVPQWTDHPDR
jgi:hypothetical protein